MQNIPLEKSKNHLGINEAPSGKIDDSPTFKSKPSGKRHAFNIFKENKPMIIDAVSYSASKYSSNNPGNRIYDIKRLFESSEGELKFKVSRGSNFSLLSAKKACNYLNTTDIDGAKPMKFRHRFKKIVEEANNKSHFMH